MEGHPLIVALDAAFWTEQERREISTWIWPGRDPGGEWSAGEEGTIGILLEGREKDLEGVVESIDELHRSLEEPGGTERSWVPLRTSSPIAHPTLFALLAQAHRGSPDVPLRELRRILDEKDPVGSGQPRTVGEFIWLRLSPEARAQSVARDVATRELFRWKSLAEEGPTPSWRGELMVRVEAYLRTHRSSPSLEKLAPPVMREWLGRQERPTLIVAFGLTERPIWNLHLR